MQVYCGRLVAGGIRADLSHLLAGALLFAAAVLTGTVSAQENRPPWATDDVIAAAIQIGMDDNQRLQFRDAVTTFLEEYQKAVNKLLRAHNVSNLERKIDSKRKALVGDMDESMAQFLSEDQIPRYDAYRDLLLSKLGQN